MSITTKVKICGLTNIEDVAIINKEKPEYAGFVLFYPKSKRNISIDQAKKLIEAVDVNIKKAAVVVSPSKDQVIQIQEAGFDYIQIHGPLSKESFDAIEIPILRAMNDMNKDAYAIYQGCKKVHGFVFDAPSPGSGKTFDWSKLKELPRDHKLWILAGGLNQDNVAEAIEYIRPDVVDVSSGVEKEVGKDEMKVKEFIRRVRDEQ